MLSICSPTPSIRITPAPPEKIHPEPYSPVPSDAEDDGYRAKWLSLPLADTASSWHTSPLRPTDCPPHKVLSREQSNSFLKVSRDQRALGTQQKPNLRKELALRSQGLKQLERRAHFLSKVKELPCTATILIFIPEVPLESPTTARCPISCRGFESEFSTLEIAAENPEDQVIVNSPDNLERHEQAERGLLFAKQLRSVPKRSRRIPPSLDEITARLKPVHVSPTRDCSRSRLPNFLKALSLSPGFAGDQTKTIPARSFAQQVIPLQCPGPRTLKLGSRRVAIPRTVNVATGPTLNTSRADTARDMIVILRRRSSPPPGLGRTNAMDYH